MALRTEGVQYNTQHTTRRETTRRETRDIALCRFVCCVLVLISFMGSSSRRYCSGARVFERETDISECTDQGKTLYPMKPKSATTKRKHFLIAFKRVVQHERGSGMATVNSKEKPRRKKSRVGANIKG